MKTFVEVLQALSQQSELAAFLSDPARWISSRAQDLSEHDRLELSRVAADLTAFAEMRCRQQLDASPEARFMRSHPIGRRHLVFSAASAVLATPLAALFDKEARAESRSSTKNGERGQDDDESNGACNNVNCPDSGEICADTACENSYCNNENGCNDGTCINEVRCVDTGQCVNSDCTNKGHCADTNCVDTACTNSGSGAAGCGNSTACSDGECTNTQCP
jgi:hypothetical protein